MRRWQNTRWTDPRDLPDDWLRYVAKHGHRYAPFAWQVACEDELVLRQRRAAEVSVAHG